MASRNLKRTKALCLRYLDPNRPWTGADDRELRELVRTHEECSDWYNRSVSIHRSLVGASPGLPSAFERERMLLATMDAVSSAESQRAHFGLRWVVPLLVAGAVGIVVISTQRNVPENSPALAPIDSDYFGARGSAAADAIGVGVGITGVTESNQAYEVTAAETSLYLDDYLRITLSRTADEYPFVFVFGVQPDRQPVWYEPDPEHGGLSSVSVPRGEAIPLGGSSDPIEFKLSGRHVTGALTVFALFSQKPLLQSDVARMLSTLPPTASADTLTAVMYETLAPAAGTFVVTSVSSVIRGGRREAPQ
ncbi:MAG: hypothetical protein VX223_11765 [Myxococcota bacterium]|nr:hypothetical protein [Myxococcota bacterium]